MKNIAAKKSVAKTATAVAKKKPKTVRLPGHIYDYPKYYDLIFGSDCQAELDFLQDCFACFADRKIKKLFEPACGTGRLMVRFAKLGYQISGNDLNEKAIDFCNRRLEKYGFPVSAFVGDMCNFKLKKPVDAAFNTINSFRHLEKPELAEAHMRVMADAVAPGGLYVLGLHLTPLTEAKVVEETWTASRGNLKIRSQMWLVDRMPAQRLEAYGMKYEVTKPNGREILEDQFNFLTYNVKQVLGLIASEPRWEIASVFDFAYDIQTPMALDDQTEDVVFVLRRIE
ncbi:MAG: class I SAM-dependent methyltransferase [Pirellulaceae bacterium]|nr:class I SAM-dependent methyltransferase [Pirellulaceae bacterium]